MDDTINCLNAAFSGFHFYSLSQWIKSVLVVLLKKAAIEKKLEDGHIFSMLTLHQIARFIHFLWDCKILGG